MSWALRLLFAQHRQISRILQIASKVHVLTGPSAGRAFSEVVRVVQGMETLLESFEAWGVGLREAVGSDNGKMRQKQLLCAKTQQWADVSAALDHSASESFEELERLIAQLRMLCPAVRTIPPVAAAAESKARCGREREEAKETKQGSRTNNLMLVDMSEDECDTAPLLCPGTAVASFPDDIHGAASAGRRASAELPAGVAGEWTDEGSACEQFKLQTQEMLRHVSFPSVVLRLFEMDLKAHAEGTVAKPAMAAQTRRVFRKMAPVFIGYLLNNKANQQSLARFAPQFAMCIPALGAPYTRTWEVLASLYKNNYELCQDVSAEFLTQLFCYEYRGLPHVDCIKFMHTMIFSDSATVAENQVCPPRPSSPFGSLRVPSTASPSAAPGQPPPQYSRANAVLLGHRR